MIRDCDLNDGTRGSEVILKFRPSFMRHLRYLAKLYGTAHGSPAMTVDEYLFALAAEQIRNNPAPTQTKEEVEAIASAN